jgi:hypothetical protein
MTRLTRASISHYEVQDFYPMRSKSLATGARSVTDFCSYAPEAISRGLRNGRQYLIFD